MCAVNNLFL